MNEEAGSRGMGEWTDGGWFSILQREDTRGTAEEEQSSEEKERLGKLRVEVEV